MVEDILASPHSQMDIRKPKQNRLQASYKKSKSEKAMGCSTIGWDGSRTLAYGVEPQLLAGKVTNFGNENQTNLNWAGGGVDSAMIAPEHL